MLSFLSRIGKLLSGRTLSVISNMLILMLLSRLVDATGFGIFATVLSTALFCSIICKFGLEQIALAEAPRMGSNRQLVMSFVKSLLPIFGLGILLNFAVLMVFFAIPSFEIYLSSLRLFLYVALFVVFFSYQFILGELFRARGAFFWAGLSKGGASNLIMLTILAWIYFFVGGPPLEIEVIWLYMLMAVISGAIALTTILLTLHWDAGEAATSAPEANNYLTSGWHFFLSSLVIFLVSQSDIWISASVFSAEETGYYAAAARLILLTTFVASLVNGLFTPKLSRLARVDDLQSFEEMLRAMAFVNALSGFIVIVPLMLHAELVIYVIYGEGFESAGPLLRILLLGQIASVLVGPAGYALIVLNQGKVLIFSGMVGLVTSLGSLAIFSFWRLSQVELALSFAFGNITLQFAMFCVLKRSGVSALPSKKKVWGLIFE